MILYLIMGLMFTVGLFSDVDARKELLEELTFFQAILALNLIMICFPLFIGFALSEMAGDELREQEGEDE